MHRRRLLPIRQHLCAGGDDAEAGVETTLQVTPTPPHLLDRISPIFSPFFPVFCACSPSRRGGSNEPQAGTQGRETAGAGVQTAGDTVSAVGLTPGVRNAWQTTLGAAPIAELADAHLIQPYDLLDRANTSMVAAGGRGIYLITDQVIPTPSHLLDRISPIFSPSFLVFCAFSPSRRGGSNEPKTGTQGRETVARAPKHRFAGRANSGCSERMAGAGDHRWPRRDVEPPGGLRRAPHRRGDRAAGDPSHCTWGVERRGEFSPLGPLAAVSWPWVPACGSLEPPRRDAENAQKTRKNGEKWARYSLTSVKEGN